MAEVGFCTTNEVVVKSIVDGGLSCKHKWDKKIIRVWNDKIMHWKLDYGVSDLFNGWLLSKGSKLRS